MSFTYAVFGVGSRTKKAKTKRSTRKPSCFRRRNFKLLMATHKKAVIGQDTVCIIALRSGGRPIDESLSNPTKESELIKGVGKREALVMMSLHTGCILISEDPCLDAFPPLLIEEGNRDAPAPKAGSDEMLQDNLIIFVEFVHHCCLPSKDRVIKELRTVHKTITLS